MAPSTGWHGTVTCLISVADSVHDPVGQALFGKGTTFVRATVAKEKLFRPPNTCGCTNIGSQGPDWTQQLLLVGPLSWWRVKSGQSYRLVEV